MNALLGLSIGLWVILVLVGLFILKRIIHICPPNKVLVFSGRYRFVTVRRDDRTYRIKLGYRIIKGGKGIRIPLFEAVDSLDLANMSVEIAIADVYARGGIPLSISGAANVKIAGSEPLVRNAIERFLGKPRKAIVPFARDVIEGSLRAIVATLTPEQVTEDLAAVTALLLDETKDELEALGLVMDTVKIQSVDDTVGYMDAMRRIEKARKQRQSGISSTPSWE